MRELLFKNSTFTNKRRRVVSTLETMDKEGVRSIIRRHFICLLKELNSRGTECKPVSCIHIFKERNAKEQRQSFFCRIKGSVEVMFNGRLYLILFMHSLRINLSSTPQDSIKY